MATVKKLNETTYEVTVVKTGDEVKHLKEHVMTHFNGAKVDGFRPGHVPQNVLEKKYKKEIEDEIVNHIVSDEYAKVVTENNLKPVDNVNLIKYENEDDKIELVFTIPVLPEIKLGEYKGVKAEKEKLDITEEKLNEEIERLRANAAKLKEVEEKTAAELNDVVNINFEGFIDGEAFEGGKAEGFDLTLGSKSFIDTFEEQITGHKKGDEFDVNVTFPENYGAANLSGKPALFKVKVNSIKRKEEAELNDDLAKELGYDSLEDLKSKTKENLTKREENRIESDFRNKVVEKVVENVSVEVPEQLVQKEIQYRMSEFAQQLQMQGMSIGQYFEMTGQNAEKMRETLKESAEKSIKAQLVLDEIAKVENISATDEDVNKEIEKMAEMYGVEKDVILNDVKKSGNYARFLDNTKYQIKNRKTIDFLVNEAK
jgi:trigger factor